MDFGRRRVSDSRGWRALDAVFRKQPALDSYKEGDGSPQTEACRLEAGISSGETGETAEGFLG